MCMSFGQTQQSTQSDQGISASFLTSIDSETPTAMQTVGNLEQQQPVNPLLEESTTDVATNEAVSDSSLIHLYADQLQATPMGNYRKRRDPVKFAETKESVLIRGILQSIVIRKADVNGETVYEVVAGYGRWQIAQEILAEQSVRIRIPCLNKGKISDSEALAIALDENNKRSDDSISERAELAKEYIGLEGGDIATAALKLNVSESIFREILQLTVALNFLMP